MDGDGDGQDQARTQEPQEGQGAAPGDQGRQLQEPAGAREAPQPVGAGDYQKVLAEKNAQIEELEAKVAEAAKTAEATESLNREIADLKEQMANERVVAHAYEAPINADGVAVLPADWDDDDGE